MNPIGARTTLHIYVSDWRCNLRCYQMAVLLLSLGADVDHIAYLDVPLRFSFEPHKAQVTSL